MIFHVKKMATFLCFATIFLLSDALLSEGNTLLSESRLGLCRTYQNIQVLDASSNFVLHWNLLPTSIQVAAHVNSTGWIAIGMSHGRLCFNFIKRKVE